MSWAAVHSVHAARHDFEDEARRAASTVVEYYNRAVSTFAEFAMDVVTPGGIDNWRKYSRGEIGLPQLEESIRHDMEADLVAGMVGSLLGSVTGGGAAAFVTAGTGTIAGTSIGAEEGAIIGVTVSRSVRSAWNRFEDKKRRSSGQKTGTSRVTDRVTREYKSGKYWDGLIKDKDSAKTSGVSGKKANEIAGGITRLKRLVGGEIRADSAGNFYKFDPAHQSAKVHLEKIIENKEGFWGVAEVDPVTGDTLRTFRRFLGR